MVDPNYNPRTDGFAMDLFDTTYDAGGASGDWWRGENNEDGLAAWGESLVMWSLARMYEATLDTTYLDELASRADDVLDQRDSVRGVLDSHGESRPLWRATKYTVDNDPTHFTIHTGNILFGLLQFCRLVSRDELFAQTTYDGNTLGQKYLDYLTAAVLGFVAQDYLWNDASGYYEFDDAVTYPAYTPGNPCPINMQTAMMSCAALLYELTGTSSYATRVAAIAAARVTPYLDGTTFPTAYKWTYYGPPGNYEDIAHGALVAKDVIECARIGVTFTDSDARRMAATFRRFVMYPHTTEGIFYNILDGEDSDTPSYQEYCLRWGYNLVDYWENFNYCAAMAQDVGYFDSTSQNHLMGVAGLAKFEAYKLWDS